ncbi:uncharacterized protein LAESUDRAFT_710795 [Laetiporus sulphureus 93-53]|uniref:Serine protease n=1 Tax=Laetiporus sulphureus 93-53 TaxID=1314785 RepID=A0A165H400_9APHY|nr:uncharacterized protein LAESUDRAFT_710795 [Laetiporus sulphureus 93-53]KZT11210.1 hypothetical protein LAESUDRAFT_710795 [Laetiporus sulphureus 93-53]
MVRRKLLLPDEVKHDGWAGRPQAPLANLDGRRAFHDASFEARNVIKLVFYSGPGRNLTYGSGFILRPPDVTGVVILTAAHNLLPILDTADEPTGQPSNSTQPSVNILGVEHPITKDNCRVSDTYRTGDKSPEADYGAIILSSLPVGDLEGFGFSICLGYEQSLPGELCVTGYRATDVAGQPKTSTGHCMGCYTRRLEYDAQTEQGISGSPVWMYHRGCPTIVAIHNNGPARPGAGSRGARITLDLLMEVFSWLGIGKFGKRIRACASKKHAALGTLPPRGLYLNFSKYFSFARVRMGSGTKFNALPAEVTKDKVLYALQVADAEFLNKWLVFDVVKNEIQLDDKLSTEGLFSYGNKKKNTFKIVMERTSPSVVQLGCQCKRIEEIDGEDAESSEVSLVPYPMGEKYAFTDFCFEDSIN